MQLVKDFKKVFIYIILLTNMEAEIFEGYTLFTPLDYSQESVITYLIDNDYNIIQNWYHDYGPASMPYLMPDSSIIYPFRVPFPTMEAGGVGGGIQKQTWNGDILWEYTFSDDIYQHHHDIEPLPNGNILIIVWERKSAQDAYDMGREIISNPINQMWSSAILELDPLSGNIVWEWHLWDHLVQDIDQDLPNYGIISENPQLFDINCGPVGTNTGGPQGANADWIHLNAINYNPHLDQIVISSRLQNEIYIIDHSTTTEEAAGHTGGNMGKGGDLLYRWGNPENYDRGTSSDKILYWQHGVNWIDPNYPGGNNILIYNNNHFEGEENHAAVIEISPPMDSDGNYIILDEEPFGPSNLEWICSEDFATPMQGGAFRLPNGNTLVTQTHTSRIIEVDEAGNNLWEFEFDPEFGGSWIARAQKYSLSYLNNQISGDLNSDTLLNILDIVILVNIILNNDNYNSIGDLNQDGSNNILDIVTLANLILN